MAGIGTFISAGRSLEQAVERVRLAESLGYDSTYVTHIAGRDSLTVLANYAAHTERIRLGTGVLPIYARTPASTAQTAATIDEISGGRMVLGVGVSHRVTVEGWYGQTIDKPGRRDARVRRGDAGDVPRRGPAARGRASGRRSSGSWATTSGPSCRSTSPPSRPTCCSSPARSATASCSGSATRPTSATSSSPR